MKFQSDKLYLNCIQTMFQGEVNDVYLTEDLYLSEKPRYIAIAIKNHRITKKIWECFQKEDRKLDGILDYFASGGMDIIVMPYTPPRPLKDFYMGRSLSLNQCENICKALVLQCIETKLPYPLLYLILTQNQVNLGQDESVFFSYNIDLKKLEQNIYEKHCVVQCAKIILDILKTKSNQKIFSYKLVKMRISSEGYRSFTELYKDVTVSAQPAKKESIIRKIKKYISSNKDLYFRILIVICSILAFLALICFVMLAVFGDVPIIRLFINNFKRIGTESLLQ